MTSADWRRAVEIFEELLARDRQAREAGLRELTRGDGALAAAVRRLLAADEEAGGFLSAGEERTAAPAAAPAAVGRYRVVERIGRGGFGDVYRAFDPVLQREVAIKTCLLDDPAERRRFLREAAIAARLHHPNIVTVFDFGTDAGVPYLVQELLGGRDLSDLIGAGDLPALPDRVAWLAQIARGLAYAHTGGFVHRDVKPSNLRVVDRGTVKLLDFGLARSVGTAALTQSSAIVGTIPYMAPEVLRGSPADARSDVFSFGAVAWELIAGRRRLRSSADSSPVAELYEAVTATTPGLAAAVPGAPAALARLVDRCLASEPARRPLDGAAILSELEHADPPAAPRRRHALVAGLAACGLLAVAAAIVWWIPGQDESTVATVAPVAPVRSDGASGLLRIDAHPWAEVVEIRGEDENEVALNADRATTPLALPVVPGRYTVRLSHPAFADPRSCTVEVGPATTPGVCSVRFSRAEASALLEELRFPK